MSEESESEKAPSPIISAASNPPGLPGLLPIAESRPRAILDFDLETVAAGFDDPDWVPQKITCAAWSWIGSDVVESRITTPLGLFGNPALRREVIAELLEQIRKAEMVTGHNIERFDLPILNAECMRLRLEPIRKIMSQDTKRLYRSTGFKKGQDNLLVLLKTRNRKMALNWQEWQDAYDEDGWADIRKRCESDVIGHKEMRQELISLGYLRTPREWIGWV